RRDALANVLVSLVRSNAELFHDCEGESYAHIRVGMHRETWPLESRGFREWAGHVLHQRCGKAIRAQSLGDAISTLSGSARFEGAERRVWRRVAARDDAYYIDLCDQEWRCLEVKAGSWKILEESPVRFVRRNAMRPLPVPTAGAGIAALWKLV